MSDEVRDELRSRVALPPEDAWISRDNQTLTQVVHMRHGDVPGVSESRIEGVLHGAWPKLGRVRRIPSSEHDLTVTEVTLVIGADGEIHPVDPDQR